jgi:ketosteroid isomerase-like protein
MTRMMKRNALLGALLTCLTVAPAARADDAGDVAVAVEKMRAAMVAADGATLNTLMDDALSYGHSDGRVDSKASFVGALDGKPRFPRIDLSAQSVAVTGANAVVRHIFDADVRAADGKINPAYIGVLQVWRKSASGWQLLARQAVPLKRN